MPVFLESICYYPEKLSLQNQGRDKLKRKMTRDERKFSSNVKGKEK